jgi:uncharacterized protein YwqG
MNKKQIAEKIARKAIRMKVGGFRPSDNPQASWIGKVLLAESDEKWPYFKNNPMIALCQVNLNDFPFKPEILTDIAFITIFIDGEEIPNEEDINGTSWCLRAYKSLEDLVPLAQVKTTSPIKPMQMLPEVVEQDFPYREDCPIEIPEKYNENYNEIFPNAEGIKFGGWPTLIQSEINWAGLHEHLSEAGFAFQIDSVEKARWQWGDNGVAYFGRATKEGEKDEWTFAWQCF